MFRFFFLLSRGIAVNHMRLTWAAAAIVFVVGLSGPKYGSTLAHCTLLAARLGVITALTLWITVMLVRKRVPGLRWRDMVPNGASWQQIGPGRRVAWTTFFIGMAVMFICLGALIGAIFAFVFWRIV